MTPLQLIDTVSRYQVFLERLKTQKVNDFVKVFTEITDRIRTLLGRLGVDRLDEISRTKLNALLQQLNATSGELFSKHIDLLLQELPSLAKQASEFESKALKTVLAGKDKAGVLIPEAVKVYAEVVKRPVQAMGELMEPFIRDWSRRSIKFVNGAIRVGYEQGLTVAQIIKKLEGTKALQMKDGTMAFLRRQAQAVVRTSIQHVAATAREVTYEENSNIVIGIEWVSTLDDKTSQQCQALDGQKFPLNEGPRPPIHPNCRSTTAPDFPDSLDFLDKGATRSSSAGRVDASETYYTWLKRQDAAFQDAALGPSKATLLRDGGLSAERFRAMQLDKNFDPLTLEEMRKLEPLAFARAGI